MTYWLRYIEIVDIDMTHKIAITLSSFNQDDPNVIELFERNNLTIKINRLGRTLKSDEILELLQDCSGVVAGTEHYNDEILKKLLDLKVISRCGVGIENIDLEMCRVRGIQVFNVHEGPAKAVAELVIGLALNLLRNITMMNQELKSGIWKKRMGQLFADKIVGILGFGHIGKEVAKLSEALGAHVLYYDSASLMESIASPVTFSDLLLRSDIISVNLPLTLETRRIISYKEFLLMKKNSILINCSRGGIVDENALYDALKNQRISGAAVDVFESEPYEGPLRNLNNIILSPHIGSYAKEARLKMELAAIHNLIKGLNEKTNCN